MNVLLLLGFLCLGLAFRAAAHRQFGRMGSRAILAGVCLVLAMYILVSWNHVMRRNWQMHSARTTAPTTTTSPETTDTTKGIAK